VKEKKKHKKTHKQKSLLLSQIYTKKKAKHPLIY